jgi:DNA-binding NarL/FixJ family response regulator
MDRLLLPPLQIGKQEQPMSCKAAKVLILEDQPLIVMDIEDSLMAQDGFEIVGVLSSCAAAADWLETQRPDVVILDIELRDGECIDVARTLFKRKIPFVVHSGSMANSSGLDPAFHHATWVDKPSLEDELMAAVREAAATARCTSPAACTADGLE